MVLIQRMELNQINSTYEITKYCLGGKILFKWHKPNAVLYVSSVDWTNTKEIFPGEEDESFVHNDGKFHGRLFCFL